MTVSLCAPAVLRHTVAEQGEGGEMQIFGAKEAKWFFGFIALIVVIKYSAGHM
ncbi:hypothetical protein ACWDWU_16795 [Streptomyces sp. NPDC003442]